jgi:mgtE-like transporter
VFGQIVNYTLSIPTVPTLYMVASTVVAGQILIAILNFMAYYFSILSFKKGLDPDNVGIPLITSVMDVLGSGCLILSLKVFGVI